MEVPAMLEMYALARRRGLVLDVQHVSFTHNSIQISYSIFYSCMCLTLSEWWNMHGSQHLHLYLIMDRWNMYHT